MRLMDLFEGASDVLYHYTSIHAAAKILTQGKFELSSTIGSIEEKYAPPGYPYFLSCTRTKVGGYHQMIGHSAVMFNLDGRWVNSRYKAGPVDYWGDRGQIAGYGKDSEAEDRIFSKDPTMPVGGVTAVHVYMEPMTEKDRKSWGTAAPALARKVLLAAKKNGIPAFLYEDKEAWRMQDTRKAVPITKRETLSGQEVTGRGGRTSSWLDPWLELIHKTATNQMSKKAQHLAYSLAYDSHYYMDSTIKSLENDFSNARKPNAGPDREVAVKIIDWMKKNRLNNLRQFVDALAAKWKPIKERENATPVNESYEFFDTIVEKILSKLPETKEIWFHGSRARGDEHDASDWDILAVLPKDYSKSNDYVSAVKVLQQISKGFENFDIQPAIDGDQISRIAKEEGDLLWSPQLNETLKKVKGKWALVSRKDPSKVLQYYHGSGHPSKEWVSKVERRVHSFSEDAASNSFTISTEVYGDKLSLEARNGEEQIGYYQYDGESGRSITQVRPEYQGKGYGKLLTLKAIYTANINGIPFYFDESRTAQYDAVLDSLIDIGYAVDDGDELYCTEDGASFLQSKLGTLNEEIAPETQRLEVKTSSTGKRTFFEGYLKADADETPAWLRVVQKPKLVVEATCEIDANGDCYIGHIQAHREYKGFATELVKHVLDYYRDQGVNNFKAYINHNNSGSKNVFRKLGFAETGRQRDGSFWTLTV